MQLTRWEMAVLSMPVIAAPISETKSRVSCGANSDSDSLRRMIKVIGSPGTKPAGNRVSLSRKGMMSSPRTFSSDDRALVKVQVRANGAQELVTGGPQLLIAQVHAEHAYMQ
jgi:hypothetical protein